MKRIYLVLVTLLTIAIGCQKEEGFSLELLKAKFSSIVVPTDKEILTVLPVESATKSANITLDQGNQPALRVNVYELDEQTFQVNETTVVKYWKYYEILGSQIKKSGTISKIFTVKNGNIDLGSYEIRYLIDCPFVSYFSLLTHNGNVAQVHAYLRLNNGEQNDWYLNYYNGEIPLPQIGHAKWQLEVIFNDGNVEQTYSSEFFTNFGPREVDLKLKIKSENTISFLEIRKEIIKDGLMLRIFDINGNFVEYRLLDDEELPEWIRFRVPFVISNFVIYYEYNGGIWYDVEITGVSTENAIKYYGIKK